MEENKKYMDALEEEADKLFFSQPFTDDHGEITIELSQEQFRGLAYYFAKWQVDKLKKTCEIIDKAWFEYLKKAWYDEGYINGKYDKQNK